MKKTAMQELIEWVDKELKLLGYEHSTIINKAEQLLEKEKQQIIDAYKQGQSHIGNPKIKDAEQYFNQTHNAPTK